MGKYEPLSRYLEDVDGDSWVGSFDQIERILSFGLPPSAHEYKAWWSNEKGRGHSQKEGWQSAGWETREIDLREKRVRFVRRRDKPAELGKPSLRDLWRQAEELSGIADREELERIAVTSFIHREAGRQLAAMGGTMPDFVVPPRERPSW